MRNDDRIVVGRGWIYLNSERRLDAKNVGQSKQSLVDYTAHLYVFRASWQI